MRPDPRTDTPRSPDLPDLPEKEAIANRQRWFQSLLLSDDPPVAAEIDPILTPSHSLGAADRLAIYRRAIRLRLIRALREQLPLLRLTLGDDLFDGFAGDYLDRSPPRSYTLERLDDSFVDYLERGRPDEDARAWWPLFMVDLVRVDQLIRRVFHAPDDAARGEARLRFPLLQYANAIRAGRKPPFPAPSATRLTAWRDGGRIHFQED